MPRAASRLFVIKALYYKNW